MSGVIAEFDEQDSADTRLLNDAARPSVDPIQQRYRDVMLRKQRIHGELQAVLKEERELKALLRQGTCELCGAPFQRVRPTKRFCTMKCTMQASAHRRDVSYNVPMMKRQMRFLELMMTPTNVTILRALIGGETTYSVARMHEVSHQRISQIASRATRLAKAAELAQAVKSEGGAA